MIDIILLIFLIGYAVSGFRQGFVIGLLSLGGFVGGAVLSIWLVPLMLAGMETGPRRSFIVLLAVIVAAWTGQFAGALIGGRLRESMPRGPIAVLDHIAGGLSGVVAVALVLWFVAGAVRGGPSEELSRLVASSRVVQAIDRTVPPQLDTVADAFRSAVGGSTFPRVFAGVGPEDINPVAQPDDGVTESVGIRRARVGIVKITGNASCGRGQEGSGFVVQNQRVVTNAHVVAGVSHPNVQIGGRGREYAASVVAFDRKRDLAVLFVPGLPAAPLTLGEDLAHGDSAAVAGFPNDGPYELGAARVRDVVNAKGLDIYGQPGTVRRVYSLYATVQPGNSGGPVLSPSGKVVGVVFAKSLDDKRTAYALTLAESRDVIREGIRSVSTVRSTECVQTG